MKGYRTILWNVLNSIVPVMQIVDAAYSIPDEWMPYWIAIFIIGNIILRLDTNGPVGRK